MDIEEFITCNNEQLKPLIREACYSGERIPIRDEDGSLAVIVPLEDLEVLKQIEGPS